MNLLVQWLVVQVRTHLNNERGQDILVVLLLLFIIWLLVTGKRILVQ